MVYHRKVFKQFKKLVTSDVNFNMSLSQGGYWESDFYSLIDAIQPVCFFFLK